MDERKQRILHAIIQDYIKTAEPVGSRTIARNYNLGISPATVRNEMYDLEQLGFLEQPHTSAGRIPSAKGYRFYVDSMLHATQAEQDDTEQINLLWQQQNKDFTDFFFNVAKLISQISHNMSMFLAPANDTARLCFVHVLPVGLDKAVMVVITDTGALDNEVMSFSESVSPEDLANASVRFNNMVQGRLLSQLTREYLMAVIAEVGENKSILLIFTETFLRAVTKRKLFYSVGTRELLGQPEFQSMDKVQSILSILEEEERLNRLLAEKSSAPLKVKIGTENEDDTLRNLSVIQANFSAENEHLGTMAILGPTRMEYGRIIGILTYMQHFLEAIENSKKNKTR